MAQGRVALQTNPYTWPLPGLLPPQQMVPRLFAPAAPPLLANGPGGYAANSANTLAYIGSPGMVYSPGVSSPLVNPYRGQPYYGAPTPTPPPGTMGGYATYPHPMTATMGAPLVNVSCQCGVPAGCQCPPAGPVVQQQQQQLVVPQQAQPQVSPPPAPPLAPPPSPVQPPATPPQPIPPSPVPPASQPLGPASASPTGQAGPLGLPQDNYPLTRAMVDRWSHVLDGPSSHPERPMVAREISEFLLSHPEVTLEGKPRAIMERLVVNLLSTGRTGNDTQIDDSIERDVVLLALKEGGFYNLPPSIVQVLQQLSTSGMGLHGMEQNVAKAVLMRHQQGKDKPAAALLNAYESRWPAWKSNQAVPTQGQSTNTLEGPMGASSYQGIQQGVQAQPDDRIKRGGSATQPKGWFARLFGPRPNSTGGAPVSNKPSAAQPMAAIRGNRSLNGPTPAYTPAVPNSMAKPMAAPGYQDWLSQWQTAEGLGEGTPFTQASNVIPGLSMMG